MAAEKKSKRFRWLKRLLLTVLICIGLQHIPGWYTIHDFEDDYEPDSAEGIGLLALADADVDAELYFDKETRHRISRNAEILVPADTHLKVKATTVPFTKEEEVILRPDSLEIVSDRPLVFIYRFVTVAKAKVLRINPHDPDKKVKAIGRYQVLSALATAHRYERQKKVRRDYKLPRKARLNFTASFHPEHEIKAVEGVSVFTGSEPGTIRLQNAEWEGEQWTAGTLDLKFPFSDLENTVNQLLTDVFPDEIEVGDQLNLNLSRIHSLKFSDNFLELYVEGRIKYANSKRVSRMFNPSFQAHLGIEFTLPSQVMIEEALVGVELKNIYSLDFNRSNAVFDKMIRSILRKKRDEAAYEVKLQEELPEIADLPGALFVDTLKIGGDEQGFPYLALKLHFLPKSLTKESSEP